jgi:hypothetical protein
MPTAAAAQPSKQSRGGKDLFRERQGAIIDLKHPLVRLAGLVPWSDFDEAFGRFYKPVGHRAHDRTRQE